MITPIESYTDLASAIGVSALYFKREDVHPYGSHKGRSIPVMIDHYYKAGDRSFVVTGSGNAALAAALCVKEINKGESPFLKGVPKAGDFVSLDIYVGTHIAPHKLEKVKRLADSNIRVLIKERPLQALTQAVQEGMRSLRQSTDDIALAGYESLAEELAELKGISSVFVGTSSGTTAQALANYFMNKKLAIQVHIVQTSSCHVMADGFESYDGPDEASIADAIVDQVAQRKAKLIPLIKKTGGRGWVATNEAIEGAQTIVWDHTQLEVSTNSALSIAGVMQASAIGYDVGDVVVCLICGE